MAETLNGLIERVTYHNPENGFAVLKVKVKGRQDLVTVIGSTTSVSAGEHLYERVGYRAFRQEQVNEKVTLVFMEKLIRIREFQPSDTAAFRRLNEEWITRYFAIEEKDRELFDDPHGQIVAKGGTILILENNGEIVGCCALLNRDAETVEVAKMAVTKAHQGRRIVPDIFRCTDEVSLAPGRMTWAR